MSSNELLIEILSEEVPFLEHKTIENAIIKFFQENEFLNSAKVEVFSSPTRLLLNVSNFEMQVLIPAKKIKGPATNSPLNVLEGFLKKVITVRENLQEEGGFFMFLQNAKEASILSLLKEKIIPELFTKLSNSWSKTMVWNASRKPWIRPIKNLAILLNGEKIDYTYSEIQSSNSTLINGKPVLIRNFNNLKAILEENHIIINAEERLQKITHQISEIEKKEGLQCIASEKLFHENSYLTEFPEIVLGTFDEKYLSLPEKVLILSLEKNQKYFLFKNTKTNKLSNFFAICTNGKFEKPVTENILEGNKRVLRARLEDAFYYIKVDTRFPLKSYVEGTKSVIFHKNIGSIYGRIERMNSILTSISSQINPAILTDLKEAILLSKADLQTEMTKSFTELQGYIGAFYAEKEGVKAEICEAIENQYKLGTETIETPFSMQSLYLALIEKYEKITSLLKAGETPTSSRDPFGIRRDALAIIRILIEGKLNLKLSFEETFRKIILERLEFYLKNFDRFIVNAILKAETNTNEISIFSIFQKISLIQKFAPELEGYKRVFNILNSSEANEMKGFTAKPELLTAFEKTLISEFSGELSIEECIKKKPLMEDFFRDFMVIDAKNLAVSQNRVAILELIAKQISQFISY
jgi:glycyl-tRNA synthetase beta chain